MEDLIRDDAGEKGADTAENRGERHDTAGRHEVKALCFLQEDDAPARDGITRDAEADCRCSKQPYVRVLDDHELCFLRGNLLLFLFLGDFALKLIGRRQAVRLWPVAHEAIHDECEHDAGDARYEEGGMPAEGDDDHRGAEVRSAFTDVMCDTEDTVVRSELTLGKPL